MELDSRGGPGYIVSGWYIFVPPGGTLLLRRLQLVIMPKSLFSIFIPEALTGTVCAQPIPESKILQTAIKMILELSICKLPLTAESRTVGRRFAEKVFLLLCYYVTAAHLLCLRISHLTLFETLFCLSILS